MTSPVVAVILASGSGERFGSDLPKQFLDLAGRAVVEHSLARFDEHPAIDRIVLVVHPGHRSQVEALLARRPFAKLAPLVDGGATRQQSSLLGIAAIDADSARVLIHDAARPLLSAALVSRCLAALERHTASGVAVPSTDTVVQVDEQGKLVAVPPRLSMWRMQTPQGVHLEVSREAHRRATAEGLKDASDDCSLVLRYRLADVAIVPGEEGNFKITSPGDLELAEQLLAMARRAERAP